jgi:hypothetical protein
VPIHAVCDGEHEEPVGKRLDRQVARQARLELGVSAGRDPLTLQYRYVSRSSAGTKKDAKAALAALLTEVNSGAGGHKGSDATVKDLIEQWLDLRKERLSVTTWEAYAAKARFRLFPVLGDRRPQAHRARHPRLLPAATA